MKSDTTKALANVADEKFFDNWFDPIETELRTNVRGFIETMMEEANKKAKSYLDGPTQPPRRRSNHRNGGCRTSTTSLCYRKENPGS